MVHEFKECVSCLNPFSTLTSFLTFCLQVELELAEGLMKVRLSATPSTQRFPSPFRRLVLSRVVVIIVGALCSSPVVLLGQPDITLEEALDATNLVWVSGGHPWRAQTNVTQDGIDAAESGPLRSGIVAELTWLETSVLGPGTISFWWNAAATNNDSNYLDFSYRFFVNNVARACASEETFHGNWHQVVVPISVAPGELTKLRWLFETLGGCSDFAEGTAWLDHVTFVPVQPAVALSRLSGDNLTLELTAAADVRLQIEQSKNLLFWEPVPELEPIQLQNGCCTVQLPTSGSSRCFYRLLWVP